MSAPRKFDEETRGASCGCSQSSQRWRSPSQSHSAWQRSHTPYSTTTWRQTLRQRPTPRRLPCRFQARRAASSRPRQRRRPTRSARSTLGLATATTPCRSHLTAPPSGSPPSRPSRARSRTPLRWSLPSRTQEHVERDHGITVGQRLRAIVHQPAHEEGPQRRPLPAGLRPLGQHPAPALERPRRLRRRDRRPDDRIGAESLRPPPLGGCTSWGSGVPRGYLCPRRRGGCASQ